MVEYVSIAVEVMEALGTEHHAYILAAIKEGHSPQKEVLSRNLLRAQCQDTPYESQSAHPARSSTAKCARGNREHVKSLD